MQKFQLENDQVLVEFLNYGGILTKMINKKSGQNYILAYGDEKNYLVNPYFFGATIGRNAGRTFPPYYRKHSGEKAALDVNEGKVHLHGGKDGLHQVEWLVKRIDETSFQLSYEDNDSLYDPLTIKLTYRLVKNRFSIEMRGVSNTPTVCNLTNHSYFNLSSQATIEEHYLQTSSAKIQLIDEQFVPTEEYSTMNDVEYKPFDFSQEKQIKKALKLETDLSKICGDGIDLAYCFREKALQKPKIILTDSNRKHRLKVYSDQEGCVIYTLNKVSDALLLSKGHPVEKFGGITFEMQRRPNYVQTEPECLTTNYSAITIYEID
ncbi:aldose 1-epimerase [Enterococcus sp. AZ135]|uniref:aldose epimerase family protein n=1 Tax=unclassified Enterococcus TaxID=2608891 RepID=UPI003F29BAEA